MFTRRQLTKAALTAALLPGAAYCGRLQQKIAIIGAGIAGLGAARALRQAGAEVTLFEARNRIGGRIHTSRLWADLPVDLGASWIHGVKGNPIADLARKAGAATVRTSYDSSLLHIDPQLAALGARDDGEDAAEAILAKAMAWAERQDSDVSMQAALDAVAPPGSLDRVRRAQLNALVNSRYEQEYAGSSAQLSAWTIDDNEELPGGDVLFPGGYDQIVRYLAAGLDIRLNRTVSRIVLSGQGVTLGFSDSASARFDRVIVTVPLGVLKSGAVAFDPPLPAKMHSAIDRLGVGLLNKHWLRFDRVFWPRDYDWHQLVSERKGDWSEWISLAKIDNTPVLLAFSAADRADAIEPLRDREIIGSVMEAARTMFGSRIPEPRATHITRWRSDKLALGSYSFNAVGSTNADRAALGGSIGNVLHFAGEAASALYPGTVHGAYLSGLNAAKAVLKGAG